MEKHLKKGMKAFLSLLLTGMLLIVNTSSIYAQTMQTNAQQAQASSQAQLQSQTQTKVQTQSQMQSTNVGQVTRASAQVSQEVSNAQEKHEEQEENIKLELSAVEFSDEYKKWLSLPEEEKNNTIMPSPYGTSYYPSQTSKKNIKGVVKATGTSSYDLRDHITVNVKSQMNTGACWAFSMINGIETNINLATGKASPKYSVRHMEYATSQSFLDGTNSKGYNRQVGIGGNPYIAFSYLINGSGLVLEENMPFQDNEEKINLSELDKPLEKKVEQYIAFPDIYKEIQDGTVVYKDANKNILTTEQVEEIRQRIKDHIINYGSVSAFTRPDGEFFDTGSPYTAKAYYCGDSSLVYDHQISIIGWDDNYSKDNFTGSYKPSKDGAWLVLNSWGEGQNGGCYYVSYDDSFIERGNSGIITVTEKDYKNLYQYDILATNYIVAVKEGVNSCYISNIYNRQESQKEYLKEVAVIGAGKTTNVDVYINLQGELDVNNSIKVASGVSLADGEYKTIKFSPVVLTNPKFAVIVKYASSEQVMIPVEVNTEQLGQASKLWYTATANEGEGFISATGENGSWSDITDPNGQFPVAIFPKASFAIKAFTTANSKEAISINFETDGNSTWKKEQGTIVNVNNGTEVVSNPDSFKYIWTKNSRQPEDTEFQNTFVNGEEIKKSTDSGNDWYLWVMVQDANGKSYYARTEAFWLDNAKPTAPEVESNAPNNQYTNQTANVQIGGSTNLSGIAQYQYTLDNGATWNTVNQETEDSLQINQDGVYNIKARAIGNTGVEGQESEAYIIKIDKKVPVISGITENESYTSVEPTITDANNITIVLTKDGQVIPYSRDTQNKGEIIKTPGNYTLTVTDEAGNQTVVHFKIENNVSKYDLRDHIHLELKDQKQTETCWTFPMITALESNISLTRGEISPIFSTRHMEYATSKTFLDGVNPNGYNRELGSGGESILGLSYFTSGLGPVLEKDMPFQNNNEKVNLAEINKAVGQKITSYVNFPNIYKEIQTNGEIIYKDDKENILTIEQVEEIRERIKNHIINYGSVSAFTNTNTKYFNNSHTTDTLTAYYCNDNSENPNHQVSIIGWDDNYAKENFQETCRPAKNGAWLVMNSWGDVWNEGYYYISYEDVFVEQKNTGIISVEDRNYKNIYQYDILAKSLEHIPVTVKETGEQEYVHSYYAANIYTRKETNQEYLKEISLTGSSVPQTVEVYVDTSGELDLDTAIPVASEVTIVDGYQTIKLDMPVILSDSKFAVIVKYASDDKVVIPLETNLPNTNGNDRWDTATANEGEGFVSTTGLTDSWEDIVNMSYYKENQMRPSLCIKAFTIIDETEGPTITFEPNGNENWKKEQTTKVSVTDGTGVGVNESTLRYVWTQSNQQPADNEFKNWFANGSEITKNTGSGDNWNLWIRAKDNQGNVSYAVSNTFWLDNEVPTAPTITASVANGEASPKEVTIQISGSSSPSGIAKYEYSLDNGATWNNLEMGKALNATAVGNYHIIARAVNNVGTIGTPSEGYNFTIQDAKIIVNYTPNGNKTYKKEQSTKVEVQTER